jgi:predicted DNA-binding protein YlxM (UPF0122 family)
MKPGRRKGSRNGDSPTAKAIRYMHEHNVSREEAANKFGIQAHAIYGAIQTGNYDANGRYIGHKAGDSRSGKSAIYAKKHECDLREAARTFGISHQAVHQAWRRMFPDEPIPSRLIASLRDQQIA